MELLARAYDLQLFCPLGYNVNRDPLMVAAKTGNFKLLEQIISYGVNLYRFSYRACAFDLACASKSFNSLDERFKFLDLFQVNSVRLKDAIRTGLYQSPFNNAVVGNDVKLVEYLISKGGKPNPDLMDLAIRKSSVEMVKMLHVSGVQFKYVDLSSLRLACEKGSFSIAKYIIESGFDLKKEYDLLNNAINGGCLDILEMLLSYGVQPCHDNLKVACLKGNFEMVKLLIEYGADPRESNGKNCVLLHQFDFESVLLDKKEKLEEIIDYFLRIGIDLDANDSEGKTVLYKLSQHDRYLPIIEKLLEFGSNSLLSKAFLKACNNGCPNIVRCLIRNGADVNYLCPSGMNGYLYAIKSRNLETVKIAIAFSDKNHVDDQGNGPLYYICCLQSGNKTDVEIFDFLNSEGVDMNILDKKRRHPLLNIKISEKKYKFLLEKYCENDDNLNYQFCGSLEDLFLIKGKPKYIFGHVTISKGRSAE